MAADGQRYASPDASISEARARACVSIYSRIFVSLPFLNGNVEDPIVLERLIRSFDFPRRDATL
jgi:hypothetical protein